MGNLFIKIDEGMENIVKNDEFHQDLESVNHAEISELQNQIEISQIRAQYMDLTWIRHILENIVDKLKDKSIENIKVKGNENIKRIMCDPLHRKS